MTIEEIRSEIASIEKYLAEEEEAGHKHHPESEANLYLSCLRYMLKQREAAEIES